MCEVSFGEQQGGWNIKIDGINISDDVFQGEMVGWDCVDKKSKIEDLVEWLKEKFESGGVYLSDWEKSDFLDNNDTNMGQDKFKEIDEEVRFNCDNDTTLMLDDLRYLQGLEDEFVMSSVSTNELIAASDNPERFDEICKEILEANSSLGLKIDADVSGLSDSEREAAMDEIEGKSDRNIDLVQ